jgi:hypothetical protein
LFSAEAELEFPGMRLALCRWRWWWSTGFLFGIDFFQAFWIIRYNGIFLI